MSATAISLVCFAIFTLSTAADPNACAQWPTCEICLKQPSCGWCAEPIRYEDGSQGPHCAGKPEDPDNPPPGFKKWTCPKDYQNKACFGYVCDQTTFQCVSSGAPGQGVPLQQCTQQCVPPTYLCNSSSWKCDKAKPGTGTDLPSCEAACKDDLYVCTEDGKCEKSEHGGGQPKAECLTACKPSNVTPVAILGDYRGLQVNQGYLPGEWDARITDTEIVIFKPDGSIFAKGKVQTFQSQLWIQTDKALYKGIFAMENLPEVSVLSWALGAPGSEAPYDFDVAMRGDTVFVLGKCLNEKICKFNVQQYLNNAIDKKLIRGRRTVTQVDDPCTNYPDCQSCVDAPSYCGWCSVNVVYNGTIPGRQCAGINRTVTKLPFNCTGSFSIQSCENPSTGSSTGSSTDTSSSGGGSGTGTGSDSTSTSTASTGTTGSNKWSCFAENGTCAQSNSGTYPDKGVCQAQCVVTPIVPPVLQNKDFRGLDIEMNYQKGEWTAHFSNTSVTVGQPNGNSMTGKVTSTANFMTVHWSDGTVIQTIWQLQGGPVTDFFSWAWGAPGGSAPANFDEAMSTKGEREFWFNSCPQGKAQNICKFTVPQAF